jgi:hypothetical protein
MARHHVPRTLRLVDEPYGIDLSGIRALIDSNVMLEIVSCVDMSKAYNESGLDPEGPEATLRRQKARESLLLSMYLNKTSARTFSLFEATRITVREVAPQATGTFANHAMVIWAHYIKDAVLPDWEILCPSDGNGEPAGNRADALLVKLACDYDVPLISHEGITVNGVDPKSGIRKKSRAAGVRIVTPREFYGDMNELLESALFMQRYGRGAEDWARASANPDVMRESMLWFQGYYDHILYGRTRGRTEPLPIRLESTPRG